MAKPQSTLRAVPGKIRLEVVTPEGLALAENVDEFTSPSVQGEFGVLPGHLPLLAALRTGLISYRKGNDSVACAVGPGFVEVADDYAILLTDRFMAKDRIDVVATRMRLKEIDEKLAKWEREPGGAEHQEMIADELWQAALLELYGDPPSPTIRTFDDFEASEREQAPPPADDEASDKP
ncbi:MAG: ATP synthase F1 subunit epsilon [Polyangiaceae bacterium]|jgi:F-type H+-transporting ATPase subunit epsilon|nr:ATP synthase F1 subunit epsilon [Polyangiaceae bacterium]